MKRQGFISIIALLLMMLILSSCVFLLYLITLQLHIAVNSQKNIQGRMVNDENINRLIYDNNNLDKIIIPEIYTILRDKRPPYLNIGSSGVPEGTRLSIDKGDNLSQYLKSARIRLQGAEKNLRISNLPDNFEETTNIIIDVETEYEGIKNNVEVRGGIINKIFEIEESLITESTMIEYNLNEEFNELVNLIEEEIFDYDPKPPAYYVRANLEVDGYIDKSYITETLENISRTYGHNGKLVSINIKATDDNKPTIEIRGDNNINDEILIKGNIYCEGDLIISSPFELDGNLIINGGNLIINSSKKPIIRGKLIYKGSEVFNPDNVVLKTNKYSIYRYGSYLPGFIDMNIDVIKNK